MANGSLAIYCLASTDLSIDVDELDLASGAWSSQALDPSLCVGSQPCAVSGVGTTWIRFFEELDGGGESHAGYTGYLQNIATGAVIPDPADTPGQQDDLDTPSGSGQPCGVSSSAYHMAGGPVGEDVGASAAFYYQLGSFVLQQGSTNKLYRCGTGVTRRVPDGVFASSRAVLYQQGTSRGPGAPITGLTLPTLRSFYIAHPIGQPAALSKSTLYTITDQGAVWGGTLRLP